MGCQNPYDEDISQQHLSNGFMRWPGTLRNYEAVTIIKTEGRVSAKFGLPKGI